MPIASAETRQLLKWKSALPTGSEPSLLRSMMNRFKKCFTVSTGASAKPLLICMPIQKRKNTLKYPGSFTTKPSWIPLKKSRIFYQADMQTQISQSLFPYRASMNLPGIHPTGKPQNFSGKLLLNTILMLQEAMVMMNTLVLPTGSGTVSGKGQPNHEMYIIC